VDALEEAGVDSLWLLEMVCGSLADPFIGMAHALARTSRLKVGTGVQPLAWQRSRRDDTDLRLSTFQPDISPIGVDRPSVMRCRRSVLLAVGHSLSCGHSRA
jgi:hypothetical protein